MTGARHTPGPWFTARGAQNTYVISDSEKPFARTIAHVQNDARGESNAALIAAAPELADALEALRTAVLDCYGLAPALDETDAALRKAGRLP